MKNLSIKLLNSTKGSKMVSNLIFGFDNEKRNGVRLTEFNFINELPTSQMELFNLLYNASNESNRADFAINIMKGYPVK